MRRDIAKLIGYLAFVILGAVVVDGATKQFPWLFVPLMLMYPLVIMLLASDPAAYQLPFIGRLIVLAILAVAAWWIQIWPLYIGWMMAAHTMGLFAWARPGADVFGQSRSDDF
ncbi:MAG: hypothetical protein JNK74_04850 [Candidatus Hydrogenedentes bacterium]|nr:hypothetical protein [Candidatus Hydrogenedentota bacterium]